MPDQNQIEAIVEAAVTAALEKATAAFEKRVEGLVKKNSELLHEKKQLEGKAQTDAISEAANQAIRIADKLLGTTPGNPDASSPGPVVFDRAHERARDPAYYQELKAEAKRRGVELTFIDSSKPDRPEQSAAVHFRDPLRGIVYVSREQVREVGYQNLQRNVAQADDKIRIFSYRHELPDHALSLHDAALRGEGGA